MQKSFILFIILIIVITIAAVTENKNEEKDTTSLIAQTSTPNKLGVK